MFYKKLWILGIVSIKHFLLMKIKWFNNNSNKKFPKKILGNIVNRY